MQPNKSTMPQHPQSVQIDLINKGVAAIQLPLLRTLTQRLFNEMLEGKGPSFELLRGTRFAPLASLRIDQKGIELPEKAWEQEDVLGCLVDAAKYVQTEDVPPPVSEGDALLQEMDKVMEPEQIRMALDQLSVDLGPTAKPLANVVRMFVQLANLDGPLRMIGGAPSTCDIATFHQHLSALASALNSLHDPKLLGEFLQSPKFTREKYELFALHHMQLLVWLQRVQQGLTQGMQKTGQELLIFIQQIGHACRVLLFQPMLLHVVQLARYMQTLPAGDATGVPPPRPHLPWRASRDAQPSRGGESGCGRPP